jgi:hypothetical protein
MSRQFLSCHWLVFVFWWLSSFKKLRQQIFALTFCLCNPCIFPHRKHAGDPCLEDAKLAWHGLCGWHPTIRWHATRRAKQAAPSKDEPCSTLEMRWPVCNFTDLSACAVLQPWPVAIRSAMQLSSQVQGGKGEFVVFAHSCINWFVLVVWIFLLLLMCDIWDGRAHVLRSYFVGLN